VQDSTGNQAASLLVVEAHSRTSSALALAFGRDRRFSLIGPAWRAQEALELSRTHRPVLVLLDIRGVSSATVLIRDILEVSPHSRLAVHASFYQPGETRSFLELGAMDCILKGIPFNQLAARLHSLRTAAPNIPG
jgi:DNA-binding NarL/FixJ family response regulator